MTERDNAAEFFMGANSPNGFFSFYPELQKPQVGYRRFLIKGGAGTGKSSLMKKIAGELINEESLLELIHCSSDPNSLDGVILHRGKASLVDATPPHVVEPTYPGGFETVVNLCEYFDEKKLEKRLTKIVELQRANGECHKKCRGLLHCADILLKDNYNYVERCTDFTKISLLLKRIIRQELDKKAAAPGEEHCRLLSAVTNQGIVSYPKTVSALCKRVYLIHDDYGVSANALLQGLRSTLKEREYEFFSCYCPLSPESKLEHLFIPELQLGFVTQNRFHPFSEVPAYRVIHYTRFTDLVQLKQKKQFLNFNRKAASELIVAAVEKLKNAKCIHDELEKQYLDAVNFIGVTEKSDEVLSKIKERY